MKTLWIALAYAHLILFTAATPQYTKAQETEIPPPKNKNYRIAIMPFCDVSTDTTIKTRPEIQRLYNHILASARNLQGCKTQVDWVSKNRASKAITDFTGALDNFCDSYVTDSICKNFEADMLIAGEFVINTDSTVEVYYSVEDCEGIYTQNYTYLTEQPIRTTLKNLSLLYQTVANGIYNDLENFLKCKEENVELDTTNMYAEAFKLFQLGEASMVNYARAIDAFQKLLVHNPKHLQARYYMGLAHFTLNEYEAAENCFKLVPDIKDAKVYYTYSQMKSKPACWYNNNKRRQEWWTNLHPEWKTVFNEEILGNNASDTPTEAQLEELFKKTELKFENVKLPNLSGLEGLSALTQLSCNRTKLESLEGIEKLQNIGQLSLDNNKLSSIVEISHLPLLTRLYCRNNPLKNLKGAENMNPSKSVIFCGASIPSKEIERIKSLGINISL